MLDLQAIKAEFETYNADRLGNLDDEWKIAARVPELVGEVEALRLEVKAAPADPLGGLLRWMRQKGEKSLRDMAEQCAVSVVEVSKWERGRERPPYSVLNDYHEVAGVPANILIAARSLYMLPLPDWEQADAFQAQLEAIGRVAVFRCPANEGGAEEPEALHVVAEKTGTGFSLFVEEIPGVVATGADLPDGLRQMAGALALHGSAPS